MTPQPIFQHRLGLIVMVSEENAPTGPEDWNGVGSHLAFRLRGIAKIYGAVAIRDESIIFRSIPQDDKDRATHVVRLEAEWHPDPTDGVELLGGPEDGLVIELGTRLAPEQHNRPLVTEPTFEEADTEAPPTLAMQVAEYKRLGISPDHDRWVYQYQGTR